MQLFVKALVGHGLWQGPSATYIVVVVFNHALYDRGELPATVEAPIQLYLRLDPSSRWTEDLGRRAGRRATTVV